MKEELRTTRPIGVCKYIPIEGHEDSTATKQEIDFSYFIYDQSRQLYIRKGLPTDEVRWVYTKEFMEDWKHELSQVYFVMRDEMRPLLLSTINK